MSHLPGVAATRPSGRSFEVGGLRKLIAHRPTSSFIVLAYALAWTCWLPLLADRQNWVNWSVSPYLHLLGALGPAAAALIVTAAVHGSRGVRGLLAACLAWRGRLDLLTLAVLGPLVLFAVAVVAARVIEGRWPALDRFGATVEYPAVPIALYWTANLTGAAITVTGLATVPYLLRAHTRGPSQLAPGRVPAL